jgi:hypothetical protein
LNPQKKLKEVEAHQTKREIKRQIATPLSIERDVREILSRKVSGSYLGLWLLIPEHLRLGSWDLIKSWTGEYDTDINPRLAMQVVHEAALCVNGVRGLRSLCHQGFDLLNGLPFIATDKSIHYLLGGHTVAEAQSLQLSLAKLRKAKGHYKSGLFALDPHRIATYSKRIMPAKKSNRNSKSQKIMQTFFCIEAISGQPLVFTIGSSASTASKSTIELLSLMNSIPSSGGLVMADSEHGTAEILEAFHSDKQFDLLMPIARTQKIRKIMQGLDYQRKWAGYALAETSYTMKGVNFPIKLIAQRTGEISDKYEYKPFVTSSESNSIRMLTEEYPQRWTIEEFFNFEAAMGWNRASTMNLNIRYAKMSLALIAQAVCYELRKKLPKPYKNWTAKHLADSLFRGIEGDIRVKNDTIIVTYYNFPKVLNLQKYYQNLPEKLRAEGINPNVPWLYDFKIDFRFK